ncbi:hypothetical protein, partial [Halovibrio sp. HP20-59]|uniref:hypothetical protein n=1 Tax=Halovibrio sp. HP20-59 TaxID=3080275 RepID=UPI002B002DD5
MPASPAGFFYVYLFVITPSIRHRERSVAILGLGCACHRERSAAISGLGCACHREQSAAISGLGCA